MMVKFYLYPPIIVHYHLGEHVKEALEGILEDRSLKACPIICITVDSSSNIVEAAHLAGWSH